MKSKKQVPDGPHSNTQLLDLLHPEKVVKNGAGDKKGCEQRYYKTYAQSNGETSDRAGAELDERKSCQNVCDMSIDYCHKSLGISCIESYPGRFPQPQFLSYPLKN